ncbi:acyl-CoA dehydrogenase family protein [Amycolatopsis sp. NPDC003865]
MVNEHDELRASVRRFLTDKSPGEAVRHWMASEDGFDPAVWRVTAEQLGLTGLAVPEDYGGAGGGPAELGVVLEETGRALLPSPFFATVALAGQALAEAGPDAARWLPGIADGSLTATLAIAEESGSWRPEDVSATVTAGRLSGTKMFVIDGDSAALVLVVARDETGLGLFAVEGVASQVTRCRLDTLDPTRRLGRLDFDSAPAVRIGPADEAFVHRALDLAVVALAAEQVGGAQACLDAAVEYAKVRVQFGRPIGTFQAIKHKCADMLLRVESARSAARHAAAVAVGAPAELPVAAALAAAYCAETYTHAAKENIQIHGGTGYTWEHDAHLHLRRAKSSEQLFGTPTAHRARLATLTRIGGPT